VLTVRGLSVRYGSVTAVADVSLDVHKAEIVGVIGANGAGKTTVLSAIAGLVEPAGGDITFDGVSVVGDMPEKIARRGVSLVPEGRRIFGTLTVEENLRLGATARQAKDAGDLEALLERFPVLSNYRRSPAHRLSGGEQQQLAIARALMSRPRLLLLDEPSLGLAPMMVDLVFEVLAELRSDGITILLVEQNARRTTALAERTYVLSTGRVTLQGSREDFARTEAAELERAYFGTT
jgi:branched-chain amino acid transport system ATP-binding protein